MIDNPDQPKLPLPACGADKKQISISGLSSGGFMTAQMHTTYSDYFMGAGILAGGPYYCAGSHGARHFIEYEEQAMTTCMQPITEACGPVGEKLFEKAKKFADKKLIASVANLKKDRIYMSGGTKDTVVSVEAVVKQVKAYYEAAGVPEENLKLRIVEGAEHAILTPYFHQHKCDVKASPFINNCGFFQSHELLEHIYGDLEKPELKSGGKIFSFDQTEFIEEACKESGCEPKYTAMSELGIVYFPPDYEKGNCRVHVALHGCEQGYVEIGADYFLATGYNTIAASNNIIVLYPQVQKSLSVPVNPMGCWDFWGYSAPDKLNFYTREAPQMKAIIKMIERLIQQPKAIKPQPSKPLPSS